MLSLARSASLPRFGPVTLLLTGLHHQPGSSKRRFCVTFE